MTPEQIALVQHSLEVLGPRVDLVVERFYQHLFEIDPSVVHLFSTDPAVQRRKFAVELHQIIQAISGFDQFADRAHGLGVRHAHYGVRARHYRSVGDSLLWALKSVMGDDFNHATAEAWQQAYDLIAESMMIAAAEEDMGEAAG
jgi:nitric oxide dioxygenase